MPASSASPGRVATSPLPAWCGLLVGVVALAWLSLFAARHALPSLPPVLNLELTFPPGEPGRVEPIVCTGMWGEGDLLLVHYLTPNTAEIRYDHWGHGGPASAPFALEPGTSRSLHVALPAFTTFAKPSSGARAPLVVSLDRRELLGGDVPYHGRQPQQIFFGENPFGGSAERVFRGTIRRPQGNLVRGGPESYFTAAEKLPAWLRTQPWQFAGAVLASLVLAFGVSRWMRWRLARPPTARRSLPSTAPQPIIARTSAEARNRIRAWGWFGACALLATFGYGWLITFGSFKFVYPEIFGSFYDYQALSFLHGRLDVPNQAIGGEAFEAHGKLYGYFGPTPALLRLPFAYFDLWFGGLSRGFMLLYFVASLLAAHLLLRDATRLARHGTLERAAEPSRFAIAALVASVGWGSTLFFLGSRSLIFHEAILAGIAFALGSAWCSLRHLRTPAPRWWIGALIGGVLSLHCRPPTGLFALTLLGCVVVALAGRDWLRARSVGNPPYGTLWRHAAVGLLCVAGQLSLNGLAYLKFGTFDPAPLKISRPYVNPQRLAHIDGKSFHLVNVPFNVDTYVLRPNFRVEPHFPWIYLGSNRPRRDFPRAKIDLPDHTLAMPYAMPSLFALATLGSMLAAIRRPGTRLSLALLWIAVLPMTLALFAAIATAQRYTGDFCPFLIGAAAFGLAGIEELVRPWRGIARGAITLLTLASIAVTVAITVHYQGDYLWGVPEEARARYQAWRQRVDAFFGLQLPPAKPSAPMQTGGDR
ncbi:MAG: hypothetical protein ABIQ12_13200 [Opitutaceae bacterium]